MKTLFSGEAKETMTSQGLQTAGIPPEAAHLIDGGLSMVATMGGAAAIQSSRTATPILKTTINATVCETNIAKSDIGKPIWNATKKKNLFKTRTNIGKAILQNFQNYIMQNNKLRKLASFFILVLMQPLLKSDQLVILSFMKWKVTNLAFTPLMEFQKPSLNQPMVCIISKLGIDNEFK